jgi:hypothetical protein
MKGLTRRRGDAEFSLIVLAGPDPAIQLAREARRNISIALARHDEVRTVLRGSA